MIMLLQFVTLKSEKCNVGCDFLTSGEKTLQFVVGYVHVHKVKETHQFPMKVTIISRSVHHNVLLAVTVCDI